MDNLYLNLSQEEFSKGRKTLIWIAGSIFALAGLWDLYLRIFKHGEDTSYGLAIILLSLSAFIFFLGILASAKRKEHYFKVDSDIISYRFGLLNPEEKTSNWSDIERINMPNYKKNIWLVLKDGKTIKIHLDWVEKNKARVIKRHIYYAAKRRELPIQRNGIKK